MAHPGDWQDQLTQILIKMGTAGIKQSDLATRMRNRIGAEALQNELESLLADDRVQKFILPTTGKSKRMYTCWRATTKILKPDGE